MDTNTHLTDHIASPCVPNSDIYQGGRVFFFLVVLQRRQKDTAILNYFVGLLKGQPKHFCAGVS